MHVSLTRRGANYLALGFVSYRCPDEASDMCRARYAWDA